MQARQRGFSLSIVLMLGTACLVVALLVSSMAVFQLDAAQTARAREQALHLAEAAIAQTVNAQWNALTSSPSQIYGTAGDGVTFIDPNHAGCFGQTTFDTTSSWGYCTNNCSNSPSGGNNSSGWSGVNVPSSSCYIIARGVVGGITVKIDAMLSAPQFQFAVACQGAIAATNALVVKAEQNMNGLVSDANLSSTMGANIGSNTSVSGGSNSLVTGDVVSAGPVNLLAPSMVDGVIRPGSISPPTFNIRSYNNAGPGAGTLNLGTSPVTVAQDTYFNGVCNINTDLVLQNATLYVSGGPLQITGGLKGTGAVIVDGNVTINGGADLDAKNLVALLSSGDVKLTGAAATQKYFQGLVYCDGAFSATNITIAGAFVSAPYKTSTATDSGVTLGPNSTVVYIPQAANIQGSSSTGTAPSVAPLLSVGFQADVTRPLYWPGFYPPPPGGSWCPAAVLNDNAIDTLAYNAVKQVPAYAAGGATSAFGGSGGSGIYISGGSCSASGQTAENNAASYPMWQIGYVSIQYNPATNQFIAVNPPLETFTRIDFQNGPANPVTQAQMDAFISGMGRSSPTTEQSIAFFQQAQAAYMATVNPLLLNPPAGMGGATTATVPNLSLNNFLANPSPLHLVSWKIEP